jgi:hypothetical protein
VLGELVLVHDQHLLVLAPPQHIQVQVDHRDLAGMRPLRRRADVAVDLGARGRAVEGGGPPLAVRDQLDERLLEDDGRLAAAARRRPGRRAQPDAVLVLAEIVHDLVPVQAAVEFGVHHADLTARHRADLIWPRP